MPFGASSTGALAETDFQQWLTVSARADLGRSVDVQTETVARFSNNDSGLYELESSLVVGYALAENVTVWAGYVHNRTYANGRYDASEQRAREQITVNELARIGPATLSGRLRVEQRWRDGMAGVGWRVRPFARLAVPLGGGEGGTVLALTAEPFVNLNTTGFQTTPGLERVRTGVVLSVPAGRMVRIETGYLNQHRFARRGPGSGDHVLTVSLALSF